MHYLDTSYDSKYRFDPAKFLEFNTDNYDILTSYFFNSLKNLEVFGEYTIKTEVARPDLISYNIYGSVHYWEILMFYNNILLIEDLKEGVLIKYPSLTDLERFYFKLQTLKRNES